MAHTNRKIFETRSLIRIFSSSSQLFFHDFPIFIHKNHEVRPDQKEIKRLQVNKNAHFNFTNGNYLKFTTKLNKLRFPFFWSRVSSLISFDRRNSRNEPAVKQGKSFLFPQSKAE